MGKGKGSFDHWAARVAVSRILFELKGDLHEQVVRDAFRLAGNKLPGKLTPTVHGDGGPFGLISGCRTVRVCEERRSAGHGYHQGSGRGHVGRHEKASPEASRRRSHGCSTAGYEPPIAEFVGLT